MEESVSNILWIEVVFVSVGVLILEIYGFEFGFEGATEEREGELSTFEVRYRDGQEEKYSHKHQYGLLLVFGEGRPHEEEQGDRRQDRGDHHHRQTQHWE